MSAAEAQPAATETIAATMIVGVIAFVAVILVGVIALPVVILIVKKNQQRKAVISKMPSPATEKAPGLLWPFVSLVVCGPLIWLLFSINSDRDWFDDCYKVPESYISEDLQRFRMAQTLAYQAQLQIEDNLDRCGERAACSLFLVQSFENELEEARGLQNRMDSKIRAEQKAICGLYKQRDLQRQQRNLEARQQRNLEARQQRDLEAQQKKSPPIIKRPGW